MRFYTYRKGKKNNFLYQSHKIRIFNQILSCSGNNFVLACFDVCSVDTCYCYLSFHYLWMDYHLSTEKESYEMLRYPAIFLHFKFYRKLFTNNIYFFTRIVIYIVIYELQATICLISSISHSSCMYLQSSVIYQLSHVICLLLPPSVIYYNRLIELSSVGCHRSPAIYSKYYKINKSELFENLHWNEFKENVRQNRNFLTSGGFKIYVPEYRARFLDKLILAAFRYVSCLLQTNNYLRTREETTFSKIYCKKKKLQFSISYA